ncbi:MAG: starch-binding protein [Ruminococcus sp.]|nr:starch-binding protein [Ruminococcus sp.]
MKTGKRLLSLFLSLVMILSLCTVMLTATAADTTTVYFRNTANWGTVNAYYWPKGGQGAVAWPGSAMTKVEDNVYSIEVPAGNNCIIFNNGSTQTGDLDIPGANSIYDFSTSAWGVYDVSSVLPVIAASKKDGASFKSDTLDVTFTVSYADSATYSIDGKSAVSFTNSAVVTVGSGVAVGSTTTVTVTATNKNGTTTETFTYTKKEAGVVDGDGSTAPALDGYYATNPNSQVGKQASISIDGSISDWDSSMLIAQGVANDDPRVYCGSSMHEIAIDDYALYAAWDNDNLYLMWEMANVQDSVAPMDDFPKTQGNLWIYNLPIFFYFSTDPTIEGDGTVASGGTLWDSGITMDANIDTVIALSTNYSNGPFVYKANDDGKIEYNDTKVSSIKLDWGNDTISQNLYGVDKGYGHWENRVPGDTLDDTSKWVDFYASGMKHSKSIDMFYEMSIPFSALGISKSELESNGIGLMKVSTFGTSAMNTLPADPSTWDNAEKEYSNDPSTSQEKEDADHITVPLARIGKMLEGGSTPTPQPTTPQPTTPQPSTPQPSTPNSGTTPQPTTPAQSYIIGDADGNGEVNVLDATLIQKFVASLVSTLDEKAAEVDKDGQVTVIDATAVQRFLAGLGNPYGIESVVTQ